MMERLAHDHAEIDNLLGEFAEALNAHDIERSHTTLDLFWARLAVHIRAEHLHLFPAVLRVLSGRPASENSPSLNKAERLIQSLRRDHDFFMHELSRAVGSLRALATDGIQSSDQELAAIRSSMTAVQERLAQHNSVEEREIYLWAVSLLDEIEKTKLASAVSKELENMPPRFSG